jgi:hypothetical protein
VRPTDGELLTAIRLDAIALVEAMITDDREAMGSIVKNGNPATIACQCAAFVGELLIDSGVDPVEALAGWRRFALDCPEDGER